MKNCWEFSVPKFVIAKEGAINNLSDQLETLNIKKLFIVVDPTLYKLNSHAQKAIERLSKFHPLIFSDFTTNPTTSHVNNACNLYKKHKPDGILAIGGGSAIDLSKATMLVAENGGLIEDYMAGKKGRAPLPAFIAVPTTCGTGSETSPFAVIADPKQNKKRGIEDKNFLPTLVVIDSNMLTTLDTTILAASSVDALAHILESFISKKANDITRSTARGLLINICQHMEAAALSRSTISISAMLNNAFTSRLLYPRTGLTIAHALSHPLGAYTNIHHGVAVSIFLLPSLTLNYPYCKEQADEAFKIMGFKEFDEFAQWLTSFYQNTGIANYAATFLSDKNPPVSIMAADAMESSNIQSNPKEVNAKELESLILDTLSQWSKK